MLSDRSAKRFAQDDGCVEGLKHIWRGYEKPKDRKSHRLRMTALSAGLKVGISILSISIFDSDYVLVRTELLEKAKTVLRRHFELVG
jgi:hypothetical protein